MVVVVLLLLGGGSCPSHAASDGCSMVVVVLLLVGRGSCPSPADSDDCSMVVGGGGSVTVPAPGPLPYLPAGVGSLLFLAAAGAGFLVFLAAAGEGSFVFLAAAWAGSLLLPAAVTGSIPLRLPGPGSFTLRTCALDPFRMVTTGPVDWVGEGGTDTVGEDTGDLCMAVVEVSASEVCVLLGVVVMLVLDDGVVHAGVSVDVTGREVEEVEEGYTVQIVDVGMSASGCVVLVFA
ncbi:hypothetical protein NDU88_005153 [Pleurodeles waltl]|uniref:Secreted protein n=1 Tax=Pleurodeles waltl TaxID=8319 RepID=A0AAV7W719_PLEWA|nr:hypothetical protein NDU88_005153 [Pleurodeles waltl]